jgi:hypothetical protein
MPVVPSAANRLWMCANRGAARRYFRALRDPARAQHDRLLAYLRANADTDFGRRHRFHALRTPDDYRRAVPVHTYDDLRPSIDQIAGGAPGVLTREPVVSFALTSGSSSAEKWIPYTRTLLAEFNRGIAPWINSLYAACPAARRGRAYWSVSPVGMRTARPSVIPVGFDDDSAYVGALFKPLVDATLAVPGPLRHVEDVATFRYLTLLLLLRARDLSLISVWHPTFFLLLLGDAPAYWEALLRDIHDGTCTPPGPIPDAARPALHAAARAAPARARELRPLDPAAPRHFWPRLAVISAWEDAHAAPSARRLAALFPNARLQGKGLLATEGVTSLPVEHAGATHYPLALCSHYFEFLADDGRPRLAHELDAHAAYTVLLTTGGGLYRYATGDRILVTGRLFNTPCVRFLGKAGLVSDLRGEKLDAAFVQTVLADFCRRFALAPAFSMLAPRLPDPALAPGYTLFLELPAGPPPPAADAALDALLCQNPHYAYCRRLGQLAPPRLSFLRANAEAVYLDACARRGQRLGAVKPTPLHPGDFWESAFSGHLATPTGHGLAADAPRAANE